MQDRQRCKDSELSNPGPASTDEASLWKLKFNTFYSYRWHSGLYRFWKFWEDAAAIFPILLSLSVVGVFVDKLDNIFSMVLAVISTVLSVLSVSKGFGRNAAFYSRQSKRYLSLFSKVDRGDAKDDIESLWNTFDEIEMDDIEEGLDAYGIYCYNKTAIKLGVPDACRPLSWFRKLTMCFF